ncbi:MAG: carbohydrate ABC transporter permease [Vallitalea sp.]|jgi:raffinose/stachyose/melibiose transport system permease protein|nr:carbohydrate ABC transporter permease [Vallitalea sp.]
MYRVDKKVKTSRIIIIIFMSFIALIQLFPLIWVFNFSLLNSSDLFVSGILKWPNNPQFQNYVIAWTRGKIPEFFINSIFVCSVTVLVTIFLSLTLSYACTRMKWRLSGFFLTIILLGMMIPVHTTLLPNYLVFNKVGIIDSYWALIIPYIAFSLPMGVFIMTGFLRSIPRSLEESAVMDGCNIYAIIFKIILPLTKPALVTITIMTFLTCWNEFIMAATYLVSERYKTLPFSIVKFTNEYGTNYAYQFAVMTLSSLPALVIYIILNKQITKGIMLGAVKG